jgi:hypothetical protein
MVAMCLPVGGPDDTWLPKDGDAADAAPFFGPGGEGEIGPQGGQGRRNLTARFACHDHRAVVVHGEAFGIPM